MFRLLFLLAALTIATRASADRLWLTDGGRIEGELVAIDGTAVLFRTGFAGTLRIERRHVLGIGTDRSREMHARNGDRIVGSLLFDPETGKQFRVDSGAARRPLVLDAIATLARDEDIAPLELAESERPPDASDEAGETGETDAGRHWTEARIQLGLNGASGNSDRLNVNGRSNAKLESGDDRLDLALQWRFSREDGSKTENETILRSSYESDLSERWFLFASQSLERDGFEDLDLRSIGNLGAGLFLIRREGHELKPRVGIGVQVEIFDTGPDEQEAVLALGYDYLLAFNSAFRLTQRVTWQGSVSSPVEDYRIDSETAVDIPVANSKAWNVQLGVRTAFNSTPLVGNDKLDIFYSATLGYKFR